MIELAPNSAMGYYNLVNCQHGADIPDGTIEHMVRMLGSKSLPGGQRLSLHYSFATVYDSRGEYAEAFAHLMSANSSRARLKGRYSTEPLRRELEATTKVFDPEFISTMSKYGCQDDFLTSRKRQRVRFAHAAEKPRNPRRRRGPVPLESGGGRPSDLGWALRSSSSWS